MFTTYSYTAHSNREKAQIENNLKKDGFSFTEEKGFYRYYKNYIGVSAGIYMKYKT